VCENAARLAGIKAALRLEDVISIRSPSARGETFITTPSRAAKTTLNHSTLTTKQGKQGK